MIPAHSLSTLLEAAAGWAGAAPALLAPGRPPLPFARLLDQVAAVTRGLRSMGVRPADRVAVVLPPGPELAAACLGVAAGAVCAPLNPAYQAAEFDHLLVDLDVRAVLLQAGMDSPVRAAAGAQGLALLEVVPLCEAEAGRFHLHGIGKEGPVHGGFGGAEDLALLLTTSGTTARPKQVPLSHANLCASAHHIAAALALGPADRCLDLMPLFHIHGFMVLLASLAAGGSVICPPPLEVGQFLAWLEELQPTWYSAVPTMHQAILGVTAVRQDSVPRRPFRFIRSSSAALPPTVAAELERVFGVPVIEAYGMTEAAHQIATNPLPPEERKPGSVGRPVGTEVAILDPAGNHLPADATGEIAIRGPNVTHGYANDPAANAAAFSHGWLRTGDQGYLDREGYLFITGRLKELINRGGEKIAPREVEDALLAHRAVAQAAAFAVPHPTLGEDIVAAVVLREGAGATEGELRTFAAQRLADFKVPRQVLLVDEIPKGPTGKQQRLRLAEEFALRAPEGVRAPTATRTPTERALAEIWARVLGLDVVGLHDNFFALGGDSILAIRLLVETERRLGRRLPPTTLFRASTLAEMADLLGADGLSASWSALVPIQQGGAKAPLFCVHQHTGHLFSYRALSRHLGPDQPVYGISAQGVDGLQAPRTRIEEMAAEYIREIRTLQPEGPYHLAGYCFGGTVAFEMAQQFHEQGQTVALLALIQTPRAGSGTGPRGWAQGVAQRVLFERDHVAQLASREKFRYMLERGAGVALEQTRGALHAAREWFERFRTGESSLERAMRTVEAAHTEALRRYVPRVYPGRVVLFRDARLPVRYRGDPTLGWGSLAAGGIEVHAIPSDRPTIVEDPPVRRLAEQLRACLDGAQRAGHGA